MDQEHYIGRGIGLAVMDTGAFPHPDFRERLVGFQDVVHQKSQYYDDNGHGTHILGIAAGDGRRSGGMYRGVAPGAHLLVVKVLDAQGNGSVDHVLKGIDFLLEHYREYGIRIVNISMGGFETDHMEEDSVLVRGVEKLWDAGLVVLAAAGNYGPKPMSIATPGISRKIITVGCSDDETETTGPEHRKKNYSGRGPTRNCICKPDLVAPGSAIVSCNRMRRQGDAPYTTKSGTSMATPRVAGGIACLLEKYPSLTNVQVKLKLRESCRRLAVPLEKQGWGELDLNRLLQ
jgi:serine protease AprX